MSSKEVTFEAVITSISHVFYLPRQSKCFFIEFTPVNQQPRTKRDTLVVLIEGLHDSFKVFHSLSSEPPIGKCFEFSNVCKGGLKVPSLPQKIPVYQTNPSSRVKYVPSDLLKIQQPSRNDSLISYEGIVTDDSFATSAIYILDQKTTLVLSSVSLISNVRILKRGQRVHLINVHIDKINEKRVIYLCGRGFIWTVETGDVSNSIHSLKSISSFESNPLIRAALLYNLNVDQILRLQKVLQIMKRKFPENLDPMLMETFEEKSKLDHFVKILELNKTIFFNEPRSIVQEYLVKPHSCNLRDPEAKKKSKSDNFSKSLLPLADLTKLLTVGHENDLWEDFNRGSKIIFDYSLLKSSEILCAKILVGKIVLNARTGHYEIADDSGSIPVCFVGINQCDFPNVGDIVRIYKFKSCLEVSELSGNMLRCQYLLLCGQDFQVLSRSKSINQTTDETSSRKWKVLYSSGPILSSDESAFVFCAAREINSANINPTFLRLPIPRWSHLLPGSTINVSTSRCMIERVSFHLTLHCKRMQMQTAASSSTKSIFLTHEDKISIDVCQSDPTPDYSLSEFSEIPENELVNIIGHLSERWFEKQQYPQSQFLNPETSQSFLTSHSLQLKLRDPRCDPKSGSTISVYITNWSDHTYPLGLLPKTEIRICNVVKMTSKKGYAYFASSLFTTFQVLQHEKKIEIENPLVDVRPDMLKTDVIMDIIKILEAEPTRQGFGKFDLLVTLERIIKVSITARCSGCENLIASGRCNFVGCHKGSDGMPKFEVRCTALVEDETQSAILHLQEPTMVQDLLHLNKAEWQGLLEIASHAGELLYLPRKSTENPKKMKYDSADKNQLVFRAYCEALTRTVYCKYLVQCRPFKLSNVQNGHLDEEYFVPKLFCINFIKC